MGLITITITKDGKADIKTEGFKDGGRNDPYARCVVIPQPVAASVLAALDGGEVIHVAQ